ncbi:hypothetical protein TWF694_011621 [Orbilia ellipsospora]|uniref:Uncharacterized protein n=1 Tax=Orbilia ellipsospora TaxID=2528407 RepID=A0AAV9X8D5_9PEZI
MLVKQLLLSILLVNRVLGQGDDSPGSKGSRDQPASAEEISEIITEEAGLPFNTISQGAPDAGDDDPGMEDDLAAINFAAQSTGAPPTTQQLGIPANTTQEQSEDGEWEDEESSYDEESEEELDDEARQEINMLQLADWSSQQLALKTSNRPQAPVLNDAAGLTGFQEYQHTKQPDKDGYIGPPLADYSWRTSVILSQELWNEFQGSMMDAYAPQKDLQDAPFWIWFTCKTIVEWSWSVENLFFRTKKYLDTKDAKLAQSLDQQFTKFWRNSYFLTNKHAGRKDYPANVPGLCDRGGLLGTPTKAQLDDIVLREPLSLELIRKLFMYEKLAPNEISISDDFFAHNWNVIEFNSFWGAHWITREFTPLMRDINLKLFPNRDLLANPFPRPLGVWKRREMGYYAYWQEKYNKVYKFLPVNFPYWEIWNATQSMQLVPEMPEMLLYATHATTVGFFRGPVAFLTEIFVDMAFKAASIARKSHIGADEDFAIPGANNRARTLFAMGFNALKGAAEKNDTSYIWTPKDGKPTGLDKWDDAAEIAKNEWRDEAIRRLVESSTKKVEEERKAKEKAKSGTQAKFQGNKPSNKNRNGFRKTKNG